MVIDSEAGIQMAKFIDGPDFFLVLAQLDTEAIIAGNFQPNLLSG